MLPRRRLGHASWLHAMRPQVLRHGHGLDLLDLTDHPCSILLETDAALACRRHLAQIIHEVLPVHVLMLDLVLDGLQLLQFSLPLAEDQQLLSLLLHLEWVHSIWIHEIIQPPVLDLWQDHLGQLLVLLIDMIVQLGHLQAMGERLGVNAAHRATREALGGNASVRTTYFRAWIQAKSQVTWPLHGVSARAS